MNKGKYGIMLLVILIDQAVKAAVRSALQPGESVDAIGSIMSFTYVRNTGAAFSMMSGRTAFLVVLPLIVMILAVWYMEKHKREHWTMYVALSFIIGGGLSNMADRLIFGYVTDMFDFHFWPVFNVADIFICTGCGLLIIYIIRFYGRERDEV